MSRDSVRYGRVPKRSREDTEMDVVESVNAPEVAAPAPVEGPHTGMPATEISKEMARLMIIAHRNHNSYTEELRQTLHVYALVPDVNDLNHVKINKAGTSGSTEEKDGFKVPKMVILIWYNISFRMTHAVLEVVEFAKRVPGFQTIAQDDQLILFKSGFIEIWMTRMAKLATVNSVVFNDGTAVSRAQLSAIYNAEFVNDMFKYFRGVAELAPTESEVAIFTGSLLMCPRRAGLTEGQFISSMHSGLIDTLHILMMEEGVPDIPSRMVKFFALAEEVHALSERHHVLLSYCREHWRQLLLPHLFSEIFDIPKAGEECPPPSSTSVSFYNAPSTSQYQG